MDTRTHYQVFGVANDASEVEVKAAYRKAALRTHPDKTGEVSSEEFIKIQTVCEILVDPSNPRKYDLELRYCRPGPSYAEQASRAQQTRGDDRKRKKTEEHLRRAADRARAENVRADKEQRAEENPRKATEIARAEQQKAAESRLAALAREEYGRAYEAAERLRRKEIYAEWSLMVAETRVMREREEEEMRKLGIPNPFEESVRKTCLKFEEWRAAKARCGGSVDHNFMGKDFQRMNCQGVWRGEDVG